ncbi:MAG: spore germination protein [Firmicutes bacterium]|nr:spore germination protein [Bacillota bacterium]
MEKVDKILSYMATPDKITKREFLVGEKQAVALFSPELTDNFAIRALIYALERADGASLDELSKNAVYSAAAEVKHGEVMDDLLSGDSVVVVDGMEGFLVISTRKWETRAIAEPPSEAVLRGPREGFIEDLRVNLGLLSRRVKSPAFAVEKMKIGRVSSTAVALCYISTIAHPKVINRIRKKLQSIDIDSLGDTNYLPPLIEPHPYSIFHQTGSTEKPDVAAAKMMEGRVVILVDGSPIALTAPFLFVEDFQTGEDYYRHNVIASLLRMLRYVAAFLAIMLPGFYAAIQIFHIDMIPLKFLVTLLNAVEGIPLKPLTEILLVLLLFEIIREASVRMPRTVGMAMSIVGALVLGETAVRAGIISSPAVMIIALSSIALYTVPDEVGTFSMLRIVFTFLGGIGGIYGLVFGVLIVITELVNFDSFGTPYLAPLSPLVFPDLKDSFYRGSLRNMNKRPESVPNINQTRKK